MEMIALTPTILKVEIQTTASRRHIRDARTVLHTNDKRPLDPCPHTHHFRQIICPLEGLHRTSITESLYAASASQHNYPTTFA